MEVAILLQDDLHEAKTQKTSSTQGELHKENVQKIQQDLQEMVQVVDQETKIHQMGYKTQMAHNMQTSKKTIQTMQTITEMYPIQEDSILSNNKKTSASAKNVYEILWFDHLLRYS